MNLTEATFYFDYEHELIQSHIKVLEQEDLSDKERAIQLYNYVRENWIYSANYVNCKPDLFKASEIAKRDRAHCIDKSIMLSTLLRAFGIPTRLQFAKVKNHIATEHLEEKFGTNELTPHGMVNLYINDQWLKVSPAFNTSLCEKYNVAALEFDGERDSIFHEFDREGNQFMEYLEDYGSFDDVPYAFIQRNIVEHYPGVKNIIEASDILEF